MIASVGVDVAALERFERWSARFDHATLSEIFTEQELAYCRRAAAPGRRYALCFVGKEATAKALGTGLGAIGWTEIQALPRRWRRPRRVHPMTIEVTGAARSRAEEVGCTHLGGACGVHGNYAMAVVLASGARS
jgi:holo-[acyl-carrier protein] synthase